MLEPVELKTILSCLLFVETHTLTILNQEEDYIYPENPRVVCTYRVRTSSQVPHPDEFPYALDLSIHPTISMQDSVWFAQQFSIQLHCATLVDPPITDFEAINPFVMWLMEPQRSIYRVKLNYAAFDEEPSRYIIDRTQGVQLIGAF